MSAAGELPEEYRERVRSALAQQGKDDVLAAGLERWRAGSASDDVLPDLVWRSHVDQDLVVSLSHRTLGHEDPTMLAFLGSRTPPYATLLHGLGPQRAAGLPGGCGCFLLTAAHLSSALAGLRRATVLPAAERAEALARMGEWSDEPTDQAPGPGELLDTLPRLATMAEARGLGLLALALDL